VLRRVAERLTILPEGASVVLACSGGPDSTALALIVDHVRPDLDITLAYVAHGLRDPDDDAREAARVAALAERIARSHVALPVEVVRSGEGIEADARRARHAALEAEAERRGARAVLHGHHAEDQAETLVMRLARGTGVDGLAGMAAVSGLRVRPLLDVRRADVHRTAERIAPGVVAAAAHDPMNDDVSLARVRVRRDILPLLAELAPDPVGALCRAAALARAESDLLDHAVAEVRARLVSTFGPATLVISDELRALPTAVARRLVRGMLPPGEAQNLANVERFLLAHDGWRATLPGPVDALVDRGHHIVLPADGAVGSTPDPEAVAPAAVAPEVLVPGGALPHAPSGMTLVRDAADADAIEARPADRPAPGLRADRLSVRLRGTGSGPRALGVRCRRDGDRVRTPGGTRALGDVLSEAGVPRVLRDLLPVVVDADDRVVWVPGVVVDATAHDATAYDATVQDAVARPRGEGAAE
jgi:tRNA(Ile)-lysidine synthase